LKNKSGRLVKNISN